MRRLDYRGSLADCIVHALNLGCIHMQPNASGIRVASSADTVERSRRRSQDPRPPVLARQPYSG